MVSFAISAGCLALFTLVLTAYRVRDMQAQLEKTQRQMEVLLQLYADDRERARELHGLVKYDVSQQLARVQLYLESISDRLPAVDEEEYL